MKVSFDLRKNGPQRNNTVSFKGVEPTKSAEGFKELRFAYPFDPDIQECYLKVYKVGTDNKGNYFTDGIAFSNDGRDGIALPPNGLSIDMQKTFGFDENQPFAYNYLIKRTDGRGENIKTDCGDVINENGTLFNVISSTKSGMNKGGSMKLVIIDSQKVGYVYNDKNLIVKDENLAQRAENGIKTLTNKFGGTLAGLEYAVENGEYDNYSRIISLPIFTDDDFSAHAYWNKNCMQMAKSFGNINNYASLQRKMFAHGLNLVSDGAFVNEGLEGTHFGSLLKWGENSPYYYWFRASGLNNGPLSLGVFPKNKEFISHKIVNSPYSYTQKENGKIKISSNHNYDKNKPTYIQFFDNRMVTEAEKTDTSHLIKSYSKLSTPNVYDIHTHNDSIFPYSFEIKPEIYNKNVKNLIEYNSDNPDAEIRLDSPLAARLLSKSEYYNVDGKFESGFETWDANVDIAKLNFVFSNTDAKDLKNLPLEKRREVMGKMLRANYQVQDYTVQSGAYWTQKTDDILRTYVAQQLKNVDENNPSLVYQKIMALSDNKVFPKEVKTEVSKEEVENVLDDMYNNKRELSDLNKKDEILEGVMNTPLDAIEFGQNLTSVLASPLISKRANVKSEVGVPRFEIYKNGDKNLPEEYAETYKKMDEIFAKDLSGYAEKILDRVDGQLPENQKLFDGDEVTEYGKYVLPLLLPQITKYAVVKALAPKVEVSVNDKNGEMLYDYNALNNVHLQSFGITKFASPEDEARVVLSELQSGIKKIKPNADDVIVNSISKSLKGTNLRSFQLADLIIDKTQSGLDWRIDATKDIADVEALRNGIENFDTMWENIIDFWKSFQSAVQKKNPNVYTVAEVTDEENLHTDGWGEYSRRFPSKTDIIPKFLRETGMSAIAEYSFFFSDLQKAFSNKFESGESNPDTTYASKMVYDKMVGGNKNIIKMGAQDAMKFAYTFIGNHDKPRALHCMALNMPLFYNDLTYADGNFEARRTAYKVLKDKYMDNIEPHEVNNFDFSGVSAKAIAMAEAIRPALIDQLNDYCYFNKISEADKTRNLIAISKSISDLAGGKFMDSHFNPEAFGVKPIDVAISMAIKQAKDKYGFQLPDNLNKDYEDGAFAKVMTPAMSKLKAMMKYLVALPGMPTLFDGDDTANSGYDTKTKNMYLQGRQKVHDEWVDVDNPKYRQFVADNKAQLDWIMGIRRNPHCKALNNGAVFTLPLNETMAHGDHPGKTPVASILRQSSDGHMAISIFNPLGIPKDNKYAYEMNMDRAAFIESLHMNECGENIGIKGLKKDMLFRDAEKPNDEYYVREYHGDYFLKRKVEGHDEPIMLDTSALILYHDPEDDKDSKDNKKVSFTGHYGNFKPNAKFVAGAYNTKVCEQGKKLALVSR